MVLMLGCGVGDFPLDARKGCGCMMLLSPCASCVDFQPKDIGVPGGDGGNGLDHTCVIGLSDAIICGGGRRPKSFRFVLEGLTPDAVVALAGGHGVEAVGGRRLGARLQR